MKKGIFIPNLNLPKEELDYLLLIIQDGKVHKARGYVSVEKLNIAKAVEVPLPNLYHFGCFICKNAIFDGENNFFGCKAGTTKPHVRCKFDSRPSPWKRDVPPIPGDYWIAYREDNDILYGQAHWDGKGWDPYVGDWKVENKVLAWQVFDPYKEESI